MLLKQTPEKKLQKADEVVEDRERNELEALARKFEGKYVSTQILEVEY